MDAFFASVEQRDAPELRGKPVIVGGQPNSRGVVAACSYEARLHGVHSAMPSSQAARLCPDAIFMAPRFEAYQQCSQQLRRIFKRYTDLIEPLSLDEAYLDVSDCEQCKGSATLIAQEIKRSVQEELNLVASAGISYNKFLAKIASDMDKPDGLYVILPEQADSFIASLPIRKFFGVGKVTEQKMHDLGIHTGFDLKKWEEGDLLQHFGKAGNYFYRVARGIDERPVRSNRIRKSLGKETTFSIDITDLKFAQKQLESMAVKISGLLQERELVARTLTLKVKYQDFTLVTRSQTVGKYMQSAEELISELPGLTARTKLGIRPCRLLGLSVSGLRASGTDIQPKLAEMGTDPMMSDSRTLNSGFEKSSSDSNSSKSRDLPVGFTRDLWEEQ